MRRKDRKGPGIVTVAAGGDNSPDTPGTPDRSGVPEGACPNAVLNKHRKRVRNAAGMLACTEEKRRMTEALSSGLRHSSDQTQLDYPLCGKGSGAPHGLICPGLPPEAETSLAPSGFAGAPVSYGVPKSIRQTVTGFNGTFFLVPVKPCNQLTGRSSGGFGLEAARSAPHSKPAAAGRQRLRPDRRRAPDGFRSGSPWACPS